VITDLDVGGAERALVELTVRLPRDAFDVRVWSLTDPADDPARSLVPPLVSAGIPVATLSARGARDTLRIIRRLSADWRAWRPDVVQTFLFHANILGRLAARRAGVPRVVAGIRVAERRNRWRLLADRVTHRLVDRHVCVSQSVADFSHTVGGLPADRLQVIPNGIDASRYDKVEPVAAADLGLPSGRRLITYVGRLDVQKGLDWFLSASRAWLTALAEHDVLIVGDGPERARLEAIAAAHNPPGRIHFAGWRGDVPRILAASERLVLPSRWEGMPNIVLEAMAAGRPVLAADVEGVRELLGDDADPQVAQPGNAEEWGEKLGKLATDRQLATLLGECNRRRAVECFTLDAVTRAYAALYTALVRPAATAPDARI